MTKGSEPTDGGNLFIDIEEKKNLETEKQELTTKVEEFEKTSSTKPTTSPSTNTSSTVNNSQSSKQSYSAPSNSNSQMVWVGETGTKYHNQGCRTLKGKGHQITLQQAQDQGREPCKVCH